LSKRLRLLALLGSMILVAGLIAGCGGSDSSSGSGGPSASADTDPQTVLDTALGSAGDPITSGVLDLSFDLQSQGGQSTSAHASISGPFTSNGDQELPSVDFDVSAGAETGGPSLSFDGNLTLTPDGLFVGYGGSNYQLDDSTFQLLKQSYQQSSQLQQDQQQGGSLSQFGIDPSGWLTNVTNEGIQDVDGTETVHISGDADVAKIISDLGTIAQQTGQSGQIDSAGLKQLENSVQGASIDVYADSSDSTLRKLDVKLDITNPSGGGADSITFSVGIADPNTSQTISAPSDAKPLTDLLGQFPGLSSSLGGLAGAPSGAPATGTSSASPSSAATDAYYQCVAKAATPAAVTDCQKLLG
jgi:hypothetical protein